jgi:hypothetical protein
LPNPIQQAIRARLPLIRFRRLVAARPGRPDLTRKFVDLANDGERAAPGSA